MKSRHQADAERTARALRARNASSSKRAASLLTRSLLKSLRARSRVGRASRNAGSWIKQNRTQRLSYKSLRGNINSDQYAFKKAKFTFSNMLGQTPAERREEFAMDFARHPGVNKELLIKHDCLSLAVGKLTRDQWREVVESYLKMIDADGNQYAASIHSDTNFMHAHITWSRAKVNGKLTSMSWSYKRHREAAHQVADELLGGRSIERLHVDVPTQPSDRSVNADRRAKRRNTTPSHIEAGKILDALGKSNSIEEFCQHLQMHKIEMDVSKRESGKVRGVLFKANGSEEFLAGSSISRDLTFPRIQSVLDANREKNSRNGYLQAKRIQQQRNAEQLARFNRTTPPRERG